MAYEFTWRTCREKGVIKGDVEKSLRSLIPPIVVAKGLVLRHIRVADDGKEVSVRVKTKDNTYSPRQIAYALRKGTSGKLRRLYPELTKIPSLWTGTYKTATVGEGDRPSE